MLVEGGEIFGAMLLVNPFGKFEDAVAHVNASRYGLQDGLSPIICAERSRRWEIERSGLMINDVPIYRIETCRSADGRRPAFARQGDVLHADAILAAACEFGRSISAFSRGARRRGTKARRRGGDRGVRIRRAGRIELHS
jgi:hypothetical protein